MACLKCRMSRYSSLAFGPWGSPVWFVDEDASDACWPIHCFSFHLTGRRVQLDSQSAARGDSCGCASPPGTSGGTLLRVKYLKLSWGQQPLTPLGWVGGGLFLTRLGHHFSHWSHSSLQTEIQFGFEYRATWWWSHLLQCLFWPKVYFSSAFSKSKWWKRVILVCMTGLQQ